MYVTVQYGEKRVPAYLGEKYYTPAHIPGLASARLVNALQNVGAFPAVYDTAATGPPRAGAYHATVVLNPYVDLIDSSKIASFGTLGLSALLGQQLTTEFNLKTRLSIVEIGPTGHVAIANDIYDVSGQATSTMYKEAEYVARTWDAVLNTAIPHVANVIARTAVHTQWEQEQIARARQRTPRITPPKAAPQRERAAGSADRLPAIAGSLLPPGNAAQQYEYAFGLLVNADYDGAEAALTEFIEVSSNRTLTARAMYWLGETHYVRARYSDAARAHAKVYETFPESEKAPDSLLKAALSYASLGQAGKACGALAILDAEFPGSHASSRARAERESNQLGCDEPSAQPPVSVGAELPALPALPELPKLPANDGD